MKETKEGVVEWIGRKGTYLYIIIMLVIFPVYYTDGVFNLRTDKKNFFLFVTCLYLCIMFPMFIKSIIDWNKEQGRKWIRFKQVDIIFFIILLLALTISTIFALDSYKSFFEMQSRTISGMCFLGCIIIFFLIRKYGEYDGIVLWGWLAGSCIIYVFGILGACGIDFMHIQEGITEAGKYSHFTPLGNIDLNACYVCIMLPPIMVMYMICKEHFSQVLHGINMYMGFMFVYFIKTDSAMIAMLAGIVLLLYFAVEKEVWFERYLHISGIYLAAKITICLLRYIYREQAFPFYSLGGELLKSKWIFGEVGIYLLIIGIYKVKKDCIRESLLAVRKKVLGTGVVIGGCIVIGLIYVNVNKSSISEESLWNHLVLKDETFSGRGFIWKRTVRSFINEPFWRKLFGNGLNCFDDFIISGEPIPLAYQGFNDPHNEFLQMLSDMGILGVIGYFGLLLSTLIRALKTWKKNELQVAVALTLCVYLIQGIANEYSIFYLPLLCIFLGLANGSMTKNQNNEVENS